MPEITCTNCGVRAYRDASTATRCLPCALKPARRVAAPGRARRGVQKSRFVDGLRVCLDCPTPIEGALNQRRVALRCDTCRAALRQRRIAVQAPAHAAVAKAIASGLLQPARRFRCVDCNCRQAFVYDHRDYSKPLQVDPVCRSCNVMRGPALEG